MITQPKPEFQKSQQIRLIDVFLFGPILIYLGSKKTLSKDEKVLMILLGVATIYYNGKNYLKNEAK